MSRSRLRWRWEDQDFGFRFRAGSGRTAAEHYQAEAPGDFYVIPASQRKLSKARANALASSRSLPTAPRVVPNPWKNYERDWDWIEGPDGILLNYAGCLDHEELHRREDEGVARAMRFVTELLERPEPAPLTAALAQQAHRALLGEIYPFAGDLEDGRAAQGRRADKVAAAARRRPAIDGAPRTRRAQPVATDLRRRRRGLPATPPR